MSKLPLIFIVAVSCLAVDISSLAVDTRTSGLIDGPAVGEHTGRKLLQSTSRSSSTADTFVLCMDPMNPPNNVLEMMENSNTDYKSRACGSSKSCCGDNKSKCPVPALVQRMRGFQELMAKFCGKAAQCCL